MKLVIVGGGGFRVPQIVEVLAQARAGAGSHASLVVDELCLYDVSARRLSAMRAILTDLAFPHAPAVTTTTELREAVRGADFVFSAIRVGGTGGRIVDERVALDQGVLGQETVGPGGYAYAFRTIPVAVGLARVVRDLAPEAWVINFTNPAGIITQAMRTVLGRRVVGICDTPIGLVRRACAALGVDPREAARPRGRVDFDYAGLNHLGWLRRLTVDGVDRLPELLARDDLLDAIEEVRAIGVDWVRALGALPNEYLFYYYLNRESVARIRREDETRGQFLDRQQTAFFDAVAADPARAGELWVCVHGEREATYMAESRAESQRSARREEDIAAGGYQEVALDFMTAVATGARARMILNVANSDRRDDGGAGLTVPQLREDAMVEVPCLVGDDGAHPQDVAPISGPELGLVTAVKACEELVIEATLSGDLDLAWRAVAAHPLVDSVEVARRIVEGYVGNSPEVARVFSP